MKAINVKELNEKLRAAAEVLAPELGVAISEDGIALTACESDRLTLKKTAEGVEIGYSTLSEFCRGLSRIGSALEGEEIDEKSWMNSLCYMADASRNAVPSIDGAKKLMRLLALMGYDSMMLYTEDTYEVPEYPHFGYMRGRYTTEELKELVAYGEVIGIELIPCIQALAHFTAFMKNPEFRPMLDCDDILLIGSDKTYDFIEALFRQCAACFKSRKINIGMDEAHMVGRGKYQDINGYKKPAEVMLEHLNRVVEIARKYGFEPMMWSDMFFRMAFGGRYYVREGSIPEEVRAKVPAGLTLIYWDYYSGLEETYNHMFNCHLQFNNPCAFAGGSWKWFGLSTLCWHSINNTRVALGCAQKIGVKDIISTGWGDDGSEASQFSNMAVNLFYAEHAYGNSSDEALDKRAREVFGESFETLMLFDLPNAVATPETRKQATSCPAKYLFFNDPLLGLLDRHMDAENVGAQYAEAAKKLYAAKDSKFGYAIEALATLCDVLELKSTLGIELRAAYRAGDRDELKRLANEVIPEIIVRTKAHLKAFRKQWYAENKTFGFSTQDVRIGGLCERLSATAELVNMYLAGEVAKIEELECEALPHWDCADGQYLVQNKYPYIASPGIV